MLKVTKYTWRWDCLPLSWGNYNNSLSWAGSGDEKTEKSPFLTFLEPLLVSLNQNDSYFLITQQNGEQWTEFGIWLSHSLNSPVNSLLGSFSQNPWLLSSLAWMEHGHAWKHTALSLETYPFPSCTGMCSKWGRVGMRIVEDEGGGGCGRRMCGPINQHGHLENCDVRDLLMVTQDSGLLGYERRPLWHSVWMPFP